MQSDLVIKALLAGTVDIAKSGTHFGLIAAVRGGELKIIGGSTYPYPYQVIGQPQFKNLADLKGQKIRFPGGEGFAKALKAMRPPLFRFPTPKWSPPCKPI